MPRLRRTWDWCFWCCLLLAVYRLTLADEEGLWGPAPSEEPPGEQTPSSNQPGSVRWSPSLPESSSLPSPSPPGLPFNRRAGDSQTESGAAVSTEGSKEPINHSLENSGSGEESLSSTSRPLTTSTQDHLGSMTLEIRTDSVPKGTSDSPRSSVMRSNKDPLVSDSHSPNITSTMRDMPFSHIPTSTHTPAHAATHTHPPPAGSAQTTEPNMDAGVKHLPEERADQEEVAVPQTESLTEASTVPPGTTVPTALVSVTYQPTTINPGLQLETTLARHPLGSVTPATTPGTMAATVTMKVTVGSSATEVTVTDAQPTQSGVSEARSGPVEEHVWTLTSAAVIKGQHVSEGVRSTSQGSKVNSPIPVGTPGRKNEDQTTTSTDVSIPLTMFTDVATPQTTTDVSIPLTTFTDVATPQTTTTDVSTSPLPPTDLLLTTGGPTETPYISPHTEDWLIYDPTENEIQLLPDCNQERSGICNLSTTWASGATTTTTTTPTTPPPPPSDVSAPGNATANHSNNNPFLSAAPPMLVPLYTDWNSAMAAWGVAWDVHVYGVGCAFAALGLASALNLLCLPLRCPSGCVYFALVSLFLLAAGCTRAFSLLYDAYGHQDRLASAEAALALYEAPFPCLTAAFGLVFLLLSMRSRMQLSYSAFQRPCFLACLVAVHFAAAFGPVTLLRLYRQRPPLCLFLSLVSRGAFVALASFLSAAYFVFYVYVRADSKHIYHLNNTSPTPAERYNRCPFAESRDWNRAAATVCVSALFCLACAGLQLYAMLNAMGIAGGEEVFRPWPWWAFQFSCRVCELGVCLTLALVVAQPIYCADHLPAAGSCWAELLAAKSPILPGSYQWTLSQQEKLAIVDTGGLGEMESLPLYTLVDERLGGSLNGLDLLYHSNRALAYRDLDLDLDVPCAGNEGGSSFTSDSTADLRPPSPINLRRSIDEALFSEALFPMSLFGPMRPVHCSDLSLTAHNALPNGGKTLLTDPGLYRTSSCVEVTPRPPEDSVLGALPSPSLSMTSSCSSAERWRGSSSSCCSLYRASAGGSSLVLCPSPGGRARQTPRGGSSDRPSSSGHYQGSTDLQRCYHALGAASQESLDLDLSSEAERSVQEEFITVCRQIDASSVCSETIDL